MSLKEVAKLAGVSHTTVSLVMNNVAGTRVSQRTKERILEAAQKLDYNPNLIARRLVSGKTNSIGLFIPFETPIFRNYVIIEMLAGIQDVLNEKNFDLVVFSTGRRSWKTGSLEQIVKQKTVDGLIIVNTRCTTPHFVDNYIKTLTNLEFNFVVLQYYWGNDNIHYVGVDYERDVFKAVSYLISLGHEKIALIAGPSKATLTSKVVTGYTQALKNHNIPIDEEIIAYADYDHQKAYQNTVSILTKTPCVTSFLVGSYEMAPACLQAVKEAGLNIPRDISIICYIDSELMSLLTPPLTAVRLPYSEMGKKAAELLLDDHPDKRKCIFETEFMIRNSTDKVRQW